MTSPDGQLPFENSYHVPGCDVIAGEYPFDGDPGLGRERVRALLDAGVTVFVDLTEEGESGLLPYADDLLEEARARGVDVEYSRHEVPDMGVPARATMQQILATLDRAAAAGRRAYVHCWGGVGRTGVVIGCLLRRQGHDGEQALAGVARLFGTMPKSRFPWHRSGSPQTHEQRRFVRDWTPDG
jgi:NAD(P)-dependent dehydrogenase (short-subunit alcohol dehydrogenase family)